MLSIDISKSHPIGILDRPELIKLNLVEEDI